MIDSLLPFAPAMAVAVAYPLYMLLMAFVLAVCGVPRQEIAKWALRQADKQRLTDLIRASRTPSDPPRRDEVEAPPS